ncbi:MAG: hypothetical protein ACJ8BF_04140 [Gemmatimonadales bacterium]
MNRKVAVAAIVGGLMHTMSVLRGQEVQPVPSRVRPTAGELLPPQGIAPLTPTVAEDLQRQITELAGRVSVLEQAQANTAGFTKVGNDYVFAPTSGNVSIKAPMNFTIQGGGTMKLLASGMLEQKGAMILIN